MANDYPGENENHFPPYYYDIRWEDCSGPGNCSIELKVTPPPDLPIENVVLKNISVDTAKLNSVIEYVNGLVTQNVRRVDEHLASFENLPPWILVGLMKMGMEVVSCVGSDASLDGRVGRSNLFIANLNLFIRFSLRMPQKQNVPIVRSVEEFSKHLGLSRWTVSRILNGHEGVREETRQRVLAEMKRLNFQPNMMARSLRGGKTGLVGVCLEGIESPILARKISAIQTVLHDRCLRGVMEVTSGQPDSERNVINHFLSLKVDGIILVGSALEPDDPIFTRLRSEKTSAVAVDPAWNVPLPRVELDRHMAMRHCLRHLIQRGRSSFALLGLESDPIYGSRRLKGLREAAGKLDLSWEEAFISLQIEFQSDWSYDYGYDLAKELLQMESPPKGIIALNDEVAIGAIKAIREWGYAVPQDFSIVGFDNLSLGEWSEPTLTSIAQNVEGMIERSVQLMQDDNMNDDEFSIVKVQPDLIVRGSS